MKQDKTSEGYISNKYLRELIIKFNRMNINDTGEWCDAYERKLERKNDKNNIEEDKYELSKSFILRKREQIRELQERYKNFTHPPCPDVPDDPGGGQGGFVPSPKGTGVLLGGF